MMYNYIRRQFHSKANRCGHFCPLKREVWWKSNAVPPLWMGATWKCHCVYGKVQGAMTMSQETCLF